MTDLIKQLNTQFCLELNKTWLEATLNFNAHNIKMDMLHELHQLIEEAKIKKYNGIAWQVLDWNEPAINFYKKLGAVQFDATWVNCSIEIA